MITHIDQLDLAKRYTYQDYLTWKFEDMVELIRGKIFKMSPAPSTDHQQISFNLQGLLYQYFVDKDCRAFPAPFDVRLPLPPRRQTDNKIDTVVQPDLCVVCDESKIDKRGCLGPPDWVIEILSKKTFRKDLKEKYEVYEYAGVKEYWVISPEYRTIRPYVLDENGKYQAVRQQPYFRGDVLYTTAFPDFPIYLDKVFAKV